METYQDWRLPTIHELLTLVDYTREDPASKIIDRNAFEVCWSSTPHANTYVNAHWAVHFGYGATIVYFDTQKFYVRAVRTSSDGQLQWTKVSDEPMVYKKAKAYVKKLSTKVEYTL